MDGRLVTRAFVLTWLSTFGLLLSVGMQLPVIPLFASGPLDLGSVGVGVAVAATSPTAMLLQPIAGRVSDRRGRRPLIVTGALVLSAAVVLYTLVDSLPALVALRLVVGAGEALVFVATATIVNDLAPDERRGEAVSLYSLAVWGGLAIGPLLGEAALRDDHYDAVWLAAAGFGLVAGLVALFLPETRPSVPPVDPGSFTFVHRAAVLPGLVMVLGMIGFAGMAAFVPLYARELGLDGAGLVFALNAAIVIAVRLVGRKIPDRIGPRRAAVTAMVLTTAGLSTIAAVQTPAGLYAGTVVLALGQALVFPALMTIVVSAATVETRSAAVGSFTACADVGWAVGAVTLGGVAAAAGYGGVFAVGAIAAALALLPLSRVAAGRVVPATAVADAPP
jgi:MFS family permease